MDKEKMKFEIKYKTKYLMGWDEFPVIIIYYRRYGNKFWHKIKQDLDQFAQSKGLGNYDTCISTYWLSKEDRAEMFKMALDESYCHGSLEAYARSIVSNKIQTKMYNNIRLDEAEALISGWVTTGWKHVELDFTNQDKVKQHSDE